MPRYNQPRKTWQYTKDFKVKAVKLSYQEGIQVNHFSVLPFGFCGGFYPGANNRARPN